MFLSRGLIRVEVTAIAELDHAGIAACTAVGWDKARIDAVL